jgi:hypothetical protein
MSFEEEFDRKINQKMDEASFPFDEANWAKASSLIDADRKAVATGVSKLYIPALFIGLVSLSVLSFMYFNAEDKAITEVGKLQNELVNQKAVSSEVETTIATKEELAVSSDLKANTESVQLSPNSNSEPAKLPEERTNSREHEIKKPVVENTTSQSRTNKQTSTSLLNNKAKVVEAPDLLADSKKEFSQTTANLKNTETKPENNETTDPLINTATASTWPQLNQNAASKNNVTPEPPIVEADNSVLMSRPLTNEVSGNTEVSENVAFEQLTLREFNFLSNETEIFSTPFVLLPRYDDDYYKKANKYLSHFINLEAGAHYNLGWTSAGKKDAQGLNWFGGVNYGYYLTKRLALGIGFQAFNIAHINQPFYEATNKQYNFGSTTTTTILTSNQIYFAAIPIKIYYSLNNTNRFGLGFNTAYAFNAVNSVNTYTETQESLKMDEPVQHTKGIYKQSTNPYSYMVSAFYKLQLSKRVALNAEYILSLTDIFKNTTTIKQSEKPQGLRLSMNYTLFEK